MILDAAAAASRRARPFTGQSLVGKAERDELAYVAEGDPAMAAAMREARSTLPEFLTLAKYPRRGMEGFSVKVAIHEGCEVEHFWIHPFDHIGRRFHGRLNNTPRAVGNVKRGDNISLTEIEIVDRMYLDNGAMKGNYSARAMLKSAPREEQDGFKIRFGLDFDF